MTSRNLVLGIALSLAAATVLASNTPPKDGTYPDVIQHPVPADLSAFKQPASLVADMKAIQTGTLQQRLDALKTKVLRDQVFVKGGTFLMGDFGRLQSKEHLPWDNNSSSSPLHKVTLTSYSISRYKVTQAEVGLYVEANHLEKIGMGGPQLGRDILNATSLSGSPPYTTWDQSEEYCSWLRKLTGKPFDLPTEAQWEYAARDKGRFILYATNNGKQEVNLNVPTTDFSQVLSRPWKGMHFPIPSPIGTFPPSPLGLYGMTADEFEWVRDWYSSEYYSQPNNAVDPTGPATGREKVLRANEALSYSTTIHRYHAAPDAPRSTFRCVIDSPTPVN